MTDMDIKAELSRARKARQMYMLALTRARQYEETVISPKSFREHISGTAGRNTTEARFLKAAEYRERACVCKREMCRARLRAYELISLLDKRSEREVLICRYLMCETWARIARETGYSVRHIYRIHSRAIRSITLKTS